MSLRLCSVCVSFYEGQGRLDGAICTHTLDDKKRFLQHCRDQGVCNIEMESNLFAAFCKEAKIPALVLCCTLLDRLKGDQVRAAAGRRTHPPPHTTHSHTHSQNALARSHQFLCSHTNRCRSHRLPQSWDNLRRMRLRLRCASSRRFRRRRASSTSAFTLSPPHSGSQTKACHRFVRANKIR